MSKYQEIVSTIQKLQISAVKVRKKELAKVIKDIKKEISVFGLTARDLGLSGKKSAKPASTEAKRGIKPGKKRGRKRGRKASKIGKVKTMRVTAKKGKVSPKFMNPETKQTWSGRGLRPRWLNEAISNGKKIEEFAV